MIKIVVTGKGGVINTTFSGVISRLLARNGYYVLAIGADPDMNLASSLRTPESPRPLTDYKELVGERTGELGQKY